MARVQLSEIMSLPDILSTEHFSLNLGAIPGGGDSSLLLLKCSECVLPGISNEAYIVPLHGTERNFRGRKMWPRTMQVTFVEDATLQSFIALRTWHEYIVGTNSNVSQGGIADYSVNATLTVYDQAGNTVDSINFYNTFLQELGDVQMSGQSSAMMSINATFKYDWVQFSSTPIM